MSEHKMNSERCRSAASWYHTVYTRLSEAVPLPTECRALTHQLLAHYTSYSFTKHILDSCLVVDSQRAAALESAISLLQQQEPLQYILGKAFFWGYEFSVSPAVLIPRSETEELVAYILKQEKSAALRVLDLCTGSGCIAICLAKSMKEAVVTGVDSSAPALAMAAENANILNAKVTWQQVDLLREPLPGEQWDVIVSNPPYIPLKEWHSMPTNVVEYEPHEALFVPDEQPLLFYEKISALALHHLVRGGRLYLETHECWGQAVADMLREAGFQQVCLQRDLREKVRWVHAARGPLAGEKRIKR